MAGRFKLSANRHSLTLLFLIALSMTACEVDVTTDQATITQANSEQPVVTPGDLLNLMVTRNVDEIVQGLDDLNRMRPQGQLHSTLEALWARDTQLFPDLPWEVLDRPVVRLKIADVLAQAHRNGQTTGYLEEIHGFAVGQLRSANRDAVFASVLLISVFNEASDVGQLEQIGRREEFRRAVLMSLNSMCVPQADAAAERILAECSGEICGELREAHAEMQAFKEQSRWCTNSSESLLR